MSGFPTVELYDPENPSVDEDMFISADNCKVSDCDSTFSYISTCDYSTDLKVENGSSSVLECDGTDRNKSFSELKLNLTGLSETECVENVCDNQECSPDVTQANELMKSVSASKPTIVWKTRQNDRMVCQPALKEFDEEEEHTNKSSVAFTSSDTQLLVGFHLHDKEVKSSPQTQLFDYPKSSVHSKDESEITNTLNSELFSLVPQHHLESESDLCSRDIDCIKEIPEPDEPCHDDELAELSQPPRIIKLSRIEDPSEPDELLQMDDANCSNSDADHPRIIRLDREIGIQSHATVQFNSDNSNPAEPSDVESLDSEHSGEVPREIKLNRVSDVSYALDLEFTDTHNSQSLLKPRIIQLKSTCNPPTMDCDDSDVLHVANANKAVESSHIRTPIELVHCEDAPLSPASESIKSLSDSEHKNIEMCKSPLPKTVPGERDSCDIGNKKKFLSSTNNSVEKSNLTASNCQYLSEGEIMEDAPEEEFGIFQVSGSALSNRKANWDNKDTTRKDAKKRLHEVIANDIFRNHCDKSEDETDHSRSSKQQKMSNDSCRSKSNVINKCNNKVISTVTATLPYHATDAQMKSAAKLSSVKRKRTKHKAKHHSASCDELLVGDNKVTKRKVVVINKMVDRSPKEKKSSEQSCAVTTLHERTETPVPRSHRSKHKENRKLLYSNEKRKLAKRRIKKSKHNHKQHRGKRKHKKHKHRKHKPHFESSDDDCNQNYSRSRSRSYDHIMEIIRSEKQQSPYVRNLRSVVVHKNTLVSARQRSSSGASYNSHCGSDDASASLALASQNVHSLESVHRSTAAEHMHLSKLSYCGEIEPDCHTTLLGECMKSKYGVDFDSNSLFRHLHHYMSNSEDDSGDVKIVGVSYPAERQEAEVNNDSLTNASEGIDSESKDDGSDYEHGHVVEIPLKNQCPEEQSHVPPLTKLLQNNVYQSDTHADDIKHKRALVESKEVQTQVSLLTEALDCRKEHSLPSDNLKVLLSDCTVTDNGLLVSGLDNERENIRSPSPPASDGGCGALSDKEIGSAVTHSIQSPVQSNDAPRPVLLERMDVGIPTPQSPEATCSDASFVITMPHVCASSTLTKTIALERVVETHSDDLPQLTATESSLKVQGDAKHDYTAVIEDSTGHLSSKNKDGNDMQLLPLLNEEQDQAVCASAVPLTTPAIHQLPPVVQNKTLSNQRNGAPYYLNTSKEKSTAGLFGHRSPLHSSISSVKQLQSEPVTTVFQLQLPVVSLSTSGNIVCAPTMLYTSVPSAVSSLAQHDNCAKEHSSELLESLSFFNVKSDRIPGICEDVVDADAGSTELMNNSLLSLQQTGLSGDYLRASSVSTSSTDRLCTQTEQATKSALTPQAARPLHVSKSHVVTESHGITGALASQSSMACCVAVTHSTQQRTVAASSSNTSNSTPKLPIAPALIPLFKTLATHLLKPPVSQQTSSTVSKSVVPASRSIPAVTSQNPVFTVPALKSATTTVSSTEAITAWISSLPQTTAVNKQQPPSSHLVPKTTSTEELDFNFDDVASPRSDEIMSFSPPSSEHMMAVIKMKHPAGMKKRLSTNSTHDPKKTKVPDKAQKLTGISKEQMLKRVSRQFKLIMQPYYRSNKITKEEYKDIMRKAVPSICHSRSQDLSHVKMVRYADAYVRKVLMMRKYLAKKAHLPHKTS